MVVAVGVATLAAACGSASDLSGGQASALGGVPSSHVHGVDVNPADGAVYLGYP